ncbi:MAG: AraC family transcriptional regulator [Lacunisphaera sp.]|nr:AraC family transcriptional regulator [Lacunisphaera sp.]
MNYFKYFLPSPDQAIWGLGVTATGFTSVPPGSAYPLSRHPDDHHFVWERGRVLEALQIVFIEAGRGTFEMRKGASLDIEAGSAFVVLPGAWHRYRPDPAVGWDESWIEVQGPLVDGLVRQGAFEARSSVRRGAFSVGLDKALEEVHLLARGEKSGFDPQMSARAYAVIACWALMGAECSAPTTLMQAVFKAERHMTEHFSESIDLEALSRKLGVAYSHFRRAFRQHTGYAPWQYVLRLRLERGRRQLAADEDVTVDEIALRLGFSSGFHFSTTFKKAFGVSPDHWRRKVHALAHLEGDKMLLTQKRTRGTPRADWMKDLGDFRTGS